MAQLALPFAQKPLISAYCSRTGTRTTLAALRSVGWRLLVSATGVWRSEGFPYAIDNGAWTAFQQSKPFDEAKFRGVVRLLGAGADWIVAPDIVGRGLESLAFTEKWLPELSSYSRVLIAVQDGMTPADVRPLLDADARLGIFLGGSTEWKLATMAQWGQFCIDNGGRYYHVGRVNSVRRIRLCIAARAHSFDGTGALLFPTRDIPRLDRGRRAV